MCHTIVDAVHVAVINIVSVQNTDVVEVAVFVRVRVADVVRVRVADVVRVQVADAINVSVRNFVDDPNRDSIRVPISVGTARVIRRRNGREPGVVCGLVSPASACRSRHERARYKLTQFTCNIS